MLLFLGDQFVDAVQFVLEVVVAEQLPHVFRQVVFGVERPWNAVAD